MPDALPTASHPGTPPHTPDGAHDLRPARTWQYDPVARTLQGSVALLVVLLIALKPSTEGGNVPPPWLIDLHVTLGSLLLALVLVRVVWRLTHRPPPFVYYDLALGPRLRINALWQRRLTRAVHVGFYALLLIAPLLSASRSPSATRTRSTGSASSPSRKRPGHRTPRRCMTACAACTASPPTCC